MQALVRPQNISLGKKHPQDDEELMDHQAIAAFPIVLIATTLACCQLY
jgi:hypothetical protein